jgi:hypothetical protein
MEKITEFKIYEMALALRKRYDYVSKLQALSFLKASGYTFLLSEFAKAYELAYE